MVAPVFITILFILAVIIVGMYCAWLEFEPLHRAHVNQGDILAAYRQRHKLPQKD